MHNSPHTVQLIGRSSSHFTRVAAIFAHELGVPYELVVVYNLGSLDPEVYGGNPALKLPTLRVGSSVIFGTENICRRLAEIAECSGDVEIVWPERVITDITRSAQELTWYTMSAQVQFILTTALGKLPPDHPVLSKCNAGMRGSLAWLEEHLDQALAELPHPRRLSMLEVTLFCLIEHLMFRQTLPLDPYPKLQHFAAEFAKRPSAERTPYRVDARPQPKEAT